MNQSVPIPLEDELALGVLGRYAKLNGIPSIPRVLKSLRPSSTAKLTPSIWLLAAACGLERDEFTSRHSMIPVLYPFAGRGNSTQGTSQRRTQAKIFGLDKSSDSLKWCAECALRDVKARGFSHWRRSHQIGGIDWCIEHRTPLSKADIHPILSPPLDQLVSFDKASIETELCNPALQRLQYILQTWLQQPNPLRLEAWNAVVSQRCRQLGLRVGEIGKRDVTSDLIRHQFPISWLRRHMPEVADKMRGKYIRKVDGACVDKHLAYPTLACAAILSVLFDSAEKGLNALTDANFRVDEPSDTNTVTHTALMAFIEGDSLLDACTKTGAKQNEVEAYLRSTYAKNTAEIPTPPRKNTE